jgi:DNA modification methylase
MNNLKTRQQLIWNKNSFVIGRQDYQWKHEPCLYGWKDGAAHYFIDDRTQATVIEDKGLDFKKMKKEELVALLKEIFSDKVSTTVINEDKPMRSAEHPTMKPLKLLERLIKNSSRPGELVLDTFGGSGSTMMTCEQLNRTCYMMEIDPAYCDVIVKRWENLTGQKAVLAE